MDGSKTKLEKLDVLYSTWRRCKNMVVSWIVHFVSTPIPQSILWMDRSEDI